ncbi:hypothetical protein SAY86_031988 [Trapa natans]|uniref:Uncharacterized protein n=1 Tax=Trapa natans TaxID=22666 RepID=A0AAN7M8F4_TRANT|nr:hypothetical protein SAY86_031988 [Trapa natans]
MMRFISMRQFLILGLLVLILSGMMMNGKQHLELINIGGLVVQGILPTYIYFHLAEIQVLQTGQVREIGIYVMDEMVKLSYLSMESPKQNLSSSNLTGEVARALMDLTELTSLDLSHNQLTGQIPDLFDQMPKLKILNLSGNNLSGSIPQSLKKKQTAGTLLARFDGNPNLCRTDTCSGKVTASTRENGKYSTNLIIAISVSACVVILLGILATLWGIKRGQRQGGT